MFVTRKAILLPLFFVIFHFFSLFCTKKKEIPHPHMLMLPELKNVVLERINSGNEPYKTKYSNIELTAEKEYNPGDPVIWNHKEEEQKH